MADSIIKLPDDSGNTGKQVYTHTAVTADGTVHKHVFDVDSSALPTGAATEATLAGIKTGTDKIPASPATEGTLGTRLADATFTGRIGEVQASPTANTVLDRLKALLTGIVLSAGTALIGKVKLRNVADTADMGDATTPVRVDPTGTTAQPVTDGAGSLTVDAPVGTPVFVRLSDGAAAQVGQKTMANSLPVAIASDQTAIPVNGDVDSDAVNTLKNVQIAGHASPQDVPPAVVSAAGDRVRAWLDRFGALIVRRKKIRETYVAVFRLAEAAARLDQTFTHVANTNKQWATLHHTAGATKEVRLQKCIVWVTSAITVAPQGIIELRQLTAATAPATGNPAIVPTPRRRGGTAAEAVCLYLPTTQGTEANVNSPLSHHVFDEAVTVATVALAHPQGYEHGGIVLYDASKEDHECLQPTLPVGTLDGWAVVTRFTGATVARITVMMVFTEEVP